MQGDNETLSGFYKSPQIVNNVFILCKTNSFSFEKFCTKTRLEMATQNWPIMPGALKVKINRNLQ